MPVWLRNAGLHDGSHPDLRRDGPGSGRPGHMGEPLAGPDHDPGAVGNRRLETGRGGVGRPLRFVAVVAYSAETIHLLRRE